jgi:hypothetical protein
MGLLDRPQQPQRYGLLSPDVMGLIQSGGPRVAPAAPGPARRGRVNGLRVAFDALLGNGDPFESLDRERARLQAEADAPQERMMAQRRLDIAQQFGGDPAWLAMQTNPGAVGENLARRLSPQVLAEGSALVTPGQINGAPIMNERRAVVGDRVVGMGGPEQAPRELLTVEPSFAQRTDRYNAENPTLASGSRIVNLPSGRTVAEGLVPLEPVSLPQGGSVAPFDSTTGEFGAPVQGNPDTQPGAPVTFDATTRGALQAARNYVGSARSRIGLAREFITLNTRNPTGIGAAGPLGMAARLNPAYDRMDSIAASLIPKEREPGSGPMSDKDIALYGRAQIGIGRPGPANQAIAEAAIAQSERDIEYSAFLDEYAQRNGNIVGSTEDWQAYVNANPLLQEGANGLIELRPRSQIQSWRDFMGFGERQRGGSQARAGGGQSAGGVVTARTPAEAAALPPGTRYRTPDGQEYVR